MSLAARFTAMFAHALHRGLRADDLTTPAAVEAWAEWTPTHQWLEEHSNKGETHA